VPVKNNGFLSRVSLPDADNVRPAFIGLVRTAIRRMVSIFSRWAVNLIFFKFNASYCRHMNSWAVPSFPVMLGTRTSSLKVPTISSLSRATAPSMILKFHHSFHFSPSTLSS